MASSMRTHVAVAVICNSRNEILIAKRPEHVHQGNCWEFPGGKLEKGEDTLTALVRECQEELAITPIKSRPLIKIRHDYADKSVLLDVWLVEKFEGEARGCENQPIKWVKSDELVNYSFPNANLPIISAVQLPSSYMITPDPGENFDTFLKQLQLSFSKFDIQLVQFRSKSINDRQYAEYANEICALCHAHKIKLLLNSAPELAESIGADGVHLSSQRLLALNKRPLLAPLLVAASCHTATELQHAQSIGVDFVVLGPVQQTASHPGALTMGWQQFTHLTEMVNIPVYALGGMTSSNIPEAQASGGQGIASIRGFWC